ncbi:tRNA pseudouridine synthase Pus10 [Asbolus verrucosus]|uniref:tRNA pseudouridine(55) synthase n=1 Tax=Asbolus verrucosus TaxID=1661398 RepID=A0A482V909_ASBVE|nr:tRNA pseudouridine synthase Pus10 [Asbolus verrucosus]
MMIGEDRDETKINIYNDLMDTGCCKRCMLRFVGDVFRHINAKSQNGGDEQILKKLKLNPCVICLDLLQDASFETMVFHSELDEILQYDCDTFVNYISFPTSVLIREHAMEIYVKEKFPEFFKDHHIVPINRAWSLSIQNKLAKKLKKKYDKNSYLNIQFTTTYEFEKEESSIMCQLEDNFKKLNGKDDTLSRNAVGEFLKTISSAIFQKHVSVPPQMPGKAVVLNQVIYKHEPIFIAGRYCKYSRNLGQTPWILDNVKIVESSVQEIIFKALESVFNCKNLVFSASGREDFDVRTLGRGRPFFIKICDPKVTKISSEKFRSIEKAIKKTNLVKVRDLQFIDRKYLNNIKEELTGRNDLFELDMVTQAGTYIKEFVHGDFGRTKPSLSEIIGGHVDIVALDVLDIHLDFPPPITTEILQKN